jgi:hypothetical protein
LISIDNLSIKARQNDRDPREEYARIMELLDCMRCLIWQIWEVLAAIANPGLNPLRIPV